MGIDDTMDGNLTGNRDRSPLRDRMKREHDDSRGSPENNRDRNRERERDRSRRGDRPSRFGPRSTSMDRMGGGKKGSASDRRIFVSNVAYEYRWQDLKDLFRNEVGEVAYVELFTDENDKPRGCGIVEFESPDSVKKAVEKMHRYELKGRKLVVKEDCDRELEKYMRNKNIGGTGGTGGPSIMGGPRMRGDDRGVNWVEPAAPVSLPSLNQAVATVGAAGPQSKWGNTYGLSPQFLESLWITGPLCCKVFVANLDYKVDEKKLREVFKLAGKVVNVELSVDKEGKSRGFGVVEYEHPVEAVQAISMLHNQTLYDRKLTVRMDRVDHKAEDKLPEGLRGVGMGLGANGAPLRDIARNLPNLQQPAVGLVGGIAGGAGLGAAALSNVVGPTPAIGLGNTAGLAAGLGGVGALGGNSLIGGGGDIGLGGGIGGNAAFGTSNLGSGLGAAGGGLGGSGGLGGGSLGGGNFGGGIGGGGGFGNSSSGLGGAFGGTGGGRDFDNLGGGMGGGMNERDFRSSGGPSGFSNGPGRSGLGISGSVGGGGSGGRSDTIIVKNLPPKTTWRTLRDKFREIGEVKFAELRGSDVGLVRFNSEWDAERAVHMLDRSRMDGCTIDVNLFY